MKTELVRHEIYDDKGLVKVEFIETEVPDDVDIEQEIANKEQQLLDMYMEIQELKKIKTDNGNLLGK
jgi:hypothetical protein